MPRSKAQTSAENGKKGGRPVGTTGIKHQSTITKEQARDAVRSLVIDKLRPLVEAQIAHASGLSYVVGRERTSGKFVKLTQQQVEDTINGTDDQFVMLEVWQKEPSVQAFSDLLNRALDKPKEQEQEHSITGTIEVKWKG